LILTRTSDKQGLDKKINQIRGDHSSNSGKKSSIQNLFLIFFFKFFSDIN
jgi:hypothetical protein